jgi:hypothetical protein
MLALFLYSLIYIHLSKADLIRYTKYLLNPDDPQYLVIPKFQKSEVPHWRPGNGNSYIDLSRLYVQSVCNDNLAGSGIPSPDEDECKPTQFDLYMFEAPKDQSWKDYWEDGHYCCTEELVSEGL